MRTGGNKEYSPKATEVGMNRDTPVPSSGSLETPLGEAPSSLEADGPASEVAEPFAAELGKVVLFEPSTVYLQRATELVDVS
jgi:hypothetical protein